MRSDRLRFLLKLRKELDEGKIKPSTIKTFSLTDEEKLMLFRDIYPELKPAKE